MPRDLKALVDPAHTAVLTMEVQRGVCGDRAALPDLAAAVAEREVIPSIARLLAAARPAGVRVAHCLAEFRADRLGTVVNTPISSALLRNPNHMVVGSEEAELVPELGPAESDLVSARLHGMSPFSGTSLDAWLRNLGVRTVVATGVSVNVGVFGMVVEAVNLGYQVVVPSDGSVGVPPAYGDQVLANSLAFIATISTVDDLVAAWA